MSVPSDDELAVACPRCPAAAGEVCLTPAGAEAKGPHKDRVRAAERQAGQASRRAHAELPDERIAEPRWQRLYLASRGELEQRGAWTRLAREQVETMVRNMALADNCRAAVETRSTVEGSTGQVVANPLAALQLKLDAQALATARALKLTPDTRGTSATVAPDDGADDAAGEDQAPEDVDELAPLDELARHRKAKAAGKRKR